MEGASIGHSDALWMQLNYASDKILLESLEVDDDIFINQQGKWSTNVDLIGDAFYRFFRLLRIERQSLSLSLLLTIYPCVPNWTFNTIFTLLIPTFYPIRMRTKTMFDFIVRMVWFMSIGSRKHDHLKSFLRFGMGKFFSCLSNNLDLLYFMAWWVELNKRDEDREW